MFDLEGFCSTGVGQLPGAFSAEEAARMRATIWGDIEERSDIREADPSTWPDGGGIPPGLSLRSLKGRPAFRPLTANKALNGALEAIFGADGWTAPRRAARILLTFPSRRPWTMPGGWHMDTNFDGPTFPVPWIQLWACLADLAPGGGGTLLLAGSHRLVERYSAGLDPAHRPGNGVNFGRFMAQHPFLDRLRQGGEPQAPLRDLLGVEELVGDVPVQAVEVTGRAGDMFITHGQVLHCAAPNATERTRQMLTGAIHRRSQAPQA